MTVRFYERKALVADPRKNGVGYRDYPAEAVRRVRFIRQAQALGFTLKEIADLLALRVSPRTTCADVRAKAQAKLNDIQAKVRILKSFEAGLERAAPKRKPRCVTSARSGVSRRSAS